MPAVRVVVQMNRPGLADQELQAMVQHGKELEENEPGCLQFEYFRSTKDPARLTLLELWQSYELYDGHWRKAVAGMGSRPSPEIEFYQHRLYELVDGVWTPREPEHRLRSIAWA